MSILQDKNIKQFRKIMCIWISHKCQQLTLCSYILCFQYYTIIYLWVLASGRHAKQTQELGIRNIINVKIHFLHFNVKVKALHPLYETWFPIVNDSCHLVCYMQNRIMSVRLTCSSLQVCCFILLPLFCFILTSLPAGHGWPPWPHSSKIYSNLKTVKCSLPLVDLLYTLPE